MATVLRNLVLQPGMYVVRRVGSADYALTLEQIAQPSGAGALSALSSAPGPGMTLRSADDCLMLQVTGGAVAIQACADVPAKTAPPQLRVDRVGPSGWRDHTMTAARAAKATAAKARGHARPRGPAPTVVSSDDSPPIVSAPLSDDANPDPFNTPPVVIFAPGTTLPDISTHPDSVDRIVIGTASQDPLIVATPQLSPTVIGSGGTVVINNDPYQVIQTGGSATNYTVAIVNGHAVVTDQNYHQVTDPSQIQYGPGLNPPPPSPDDPVSVKMVTIYRVMFGTDTSAESLGYWIGMIKSGVSLLTVADALMQTGDARARFDNLSDESFVRDLYAHSFNAPADDSGVRYWVDALQRGLISRSGVVVAFADAAEPRPAVGAADTPMMVVTSVI